MPDTIETSSTTAAMPVAMPNDDSAACNRRCLRLANASLRMFPARTPSPTTLDRRRVIGAAPPARHPLALCDTQRSVPYRARREPGHGHPEPRPAPPAAVVCPPALGR